MHGQNHIKLYMFRTDLLSIVRSLNTVFTAVGIFLTSYVDCLLATSLADRQHNCMTNTSYCEYSTKTADEGQYVCPKHVELFTKIKLKNGAFVWLLL